MELHSNVKIVFTRKVIPHMQHVFQAVSQQLDTRSLWNSFRGKIKGSYCDSWHLLDFFKMWDVPGFRSAGCILLFDFCLPSVVTSRKTLKRWWKMFV